MGLLESVQAVKSAASQGLITLVPIKPARTDEDRAEALRQLPLGPDLTSAFKPPLKNLGFDLDSTDLLDPADESRPVSIATGPGRQLYLVCLPDWLLTDAQYANLGIFGMVEHLFPENSTVFIISRDLNAMAPAFTSMMEKWKGRSIKAAFIPWQSVAKLLEEENESTRLQRVRQMLKVENLTPPAPLPSAAPATALSDQDRKDVVKVLLGQAGDTFAYEKPQDYFQFLVESANLPSPAKFKAGWKGNPEIDAAALLNFTQEKQFPVTHVWAGQYMLGRVLEALLKQDLSPADSKTIFAIIMSRHLIGDSEIVSALQLKYAPAQGGIA